MNNYSCLIGLTVFCLVILLSVILGNVNLPTSGRRKFVKVFVLVIFATICEWSGNLMNGYIKETREIHIILKTLEQIVTPYIILTCSLVFTVKDEASDDQEKNTERIIDIITICYGIFEIISIPFGLIFYVDENNVYHDGKFFIIFVLMIIATFVYLFIQMYKFGIYNQFKNKRTISLIAVFAIAGFSARLLGEDVNIRWLTMGVTSVFVYLFYSEVLQNIDKLTQLLNQKSYKSFVRNIPKNTAILIFDVDNFKQVNDLHGHSYGDTILREIAASIKEVYSKYGLCFRMGGDEFCVMLQSNLSNIDKLNERFVRKIEEKRHGKFEMMPYISIGYAIYDETVSSDEILKVADKKMYEEKKRLKELRDKQ